MEKLAVELRSKHSVRIETIQADLAHAGLSGRFLGHTVENEISQINLNVRGLVGYRFLKLVWPFVEELNLRS
jgi:short-subunit dehydrogenase